MTSSDETFRVPILFERWYAVFSSVVLLPPSSAYVEIGPAEVVCRMGWAFQTRFSRSAVKQATRFERKTVSRGVHGFGGRWLVNGSGSSILEVTLEPAQSARVLGAPVRLSQLLISVDNLEDVAKRLLPPLA